MKVEYSKAFVKAVRKLSGKVLDSVRNAIQGVMEARCIDEITDCKKLVGYDFVYRIRIGSYRAFFTFHVHIENDVVMFEYLLPRGEAYDKKNQEKTVPSVSTIETKAAMATPDFPALELIPDHLLKFRLNPAYFSLFSLKLPFKYTISHHSKYKCL